MADKSFSTDASTRLKGLAIIIMMYHHCFATVSRFEKYQIDFSPFTQDTMVPLLYYGKICVSIFAFITGYGLFMSLMHADRDDINPAKIVSKRLIKLIGSFIFIYFICLVFCQLYAGLPVKKYCADGMTRGVVYMLFDALGISGLIGTPTINDTWWYMSAAIFYIVMAPVIYYAGKKIGYLSVIILAMAIPRLNGTGFPGGINPYSFIIPVILGMICARYDVFSKIYEKEKSRVMIKKVLVFLLYLIVIAAGVFICIRVPRKVMWELHFGFTPLIIILFSWKYIIGIPVLKNILYFIGVHSMTIFLTHTFIRINFCRDWIYGFGHFLLVPFVLLLVSLLLAVILDEAKELVGWNRLVDRACKKITGQ